jgi:hypothetical protein
MKSMQWGSWARLAGVALLVAGCAGAAGGLTPSATTTTAIMGWERYFHFDLGAEPSPGDISGYIYNDYGEPASNVQILAQGLDASGNLVGQKLEWVGGSVPPLGRSYFRVAGLPPANAYRVSVWAFDFRQGSGDGRR